MPPLTRNEFLRLSTLGAAASVALPVHTASAAMLQPNLPMPLSDLPTPALIVEAEPFERNLRTMAEHLKAHGIGLRPHAKTHKSAEVARRQLALGALGLCCAKISEAEALAAEGIGPLLVTSPLATADKAARFAALAQTSPGALVVVDSERGAELLSTAAQARRIELGVLIDLDVGTRRTGIACGAPAVALAQFAAARPGLRVHGVQAYAGHLMHVDGYDERRRRSLEAMAPAVETRAAIEAAGIPCPIFTGSGTGTFDIDTEIPGLTDMQCGSYPFMDVQYRVIGGPGTELLERFAPALFVWSTAISQPVPGRITLDAGYKALSNEDVRPQLLDHPHTLYSWGGDEHGIVALGEGAPPIALGDKVKIFVAHCDPTINLYDHLYLVRDGQAVERWAITARGCIQ